MKKQQYSSGLHKVYSLQFRNSAKRIPINQIKYHQSNFIKFFKLKKSEFKSKTILDTGAGPGVHSVILALMCKKVIAADYLQINVKRINKLKKLYKLKNLSAVRFDFSRKYKNIDKFDLISCHNWVQHTPNPQKTFSQIAHNMKKNSRVYISCYLAGTFRFFITQISRQILNINDFNALTSQIKNIFKDGFKKYNNIHDIHETSITDDYFSPYVITTNYKNLINLSRKCGLKLITNVPKFKYPLQNYDSYQLKLGFQKVHSKKQKIDNIYKKPIDEFKLPKSINRKKSIELAKEIIKKFKLNKYTSNQKVKFCLHLYRIRAENSRKKNEFKYVSLNNYLEDFLKKND
jgi:2-polyprenyl-3-methyl-5-hydroxy-6-metoxy-1,4-benzoquinol methylase